MSRAQSQYLRFFSGNVTHYRWQSYYVDQAVTWASASWSYQPFASGGLENGLIAGEANISIEVPATSVVVTAMEQALMGSYMAELLVYEFNPELGNTTPQSGQTLLASFIGEVVGLSGSFSSLTINLGSSLSPVDAQVPPVTFTSRLIGHPCQF